MAGGEGFWSVKPGETDPVLSRFEEAGFSIEIMHVPTGKACVFPAWLTSYNESFASTWNTQNVFGRADPIGSWNNTTRRISLGLGIPSFTPEEAYANMHQYEHLVGFLYPSYQSSGTGRNRTNVMNAYPLLKMKFANFVKNATVQENAVSVLKGGLTGWIENVDFTPNLEAGFHHMAPGMKPSEIQIYNSHRSDGTRRTTNKSHTFVPKVFEINMSFVVVHEHSLGWGSDKTWLGKAKDGRDYGFPYGYEAQGGKLHDVDRGNATLNASPMNRIRGADGGQSAASVSPKGSKRDGKSNASTQKRRQDQKNAEKKALGQ